MVYDTTDRVAPKSFAFGPFVLCPERQLLLKSGTPARLGGRALDILTVLVHRAGDLVSKPELLARVWPDTVVEEGNLKVNMAALRRVLGEAPGAPSYIATVAGRGYRFIAAVKAFESDDPAWIPGASTAVGDRLPPTTTRIVGREESIDAIRRALGDSRLVSIVGAGGIGKTTVALAVAQIVEDEGDTSVTFVDLARVAGEEFVPAAFLAALGISAVGGDSLDAVVSILAARKALLVFDTCEHVLHAAAHVASLVLARTTEVRILATSRQVLNVHGEKVEWLRPLDVPPLDVELTPKALLQYSAPQLLLERAIEKSGYLLQDGEVRAIADICRRLDGAPLAIELVSSRFGGRSAETVLGELDDRFRTLRRDRTGGPFRQQTLLATLEWSYSMLTATESAVLRAVSIFAGSFDTDSAVAVVAPGALALAERFDAISGLRAKSMLSLDQSSGQLRYRLLDTTRAFAWDLLAGHGELAAVSSSHARLQLELLARLGVGQGTSSAREWRAMLGGLADDLRKALDWALYRACDPVLGMKIVAAALPLWRELSLQGEIARNCERAVAEFERIDCKDVALKLKLVVGLATANTYLPVDPQRTIALFNTAIDLARATADLGAECHGLSALIAYTALPGREETPKEWLRALKSSAVRANDRFALWEYEQLCANWEINSCEFAACHARLSLLYAQLKDCDEGAVPRFQIYQKNTVETQLASTFWFIGRPGEAALRIERAAQNAIDTAHGLTLVHCLGRGVIWAMNMLRDYRKSRLYADLLKQTIYRHGLSTWIPLADCYSEVVDALSGARRSPEGLRLAFENHRKAAPQLRSHGHFAVLALAMSAIGQADDAMRVLDVVFDEGPARWCLPELLRARAAAQRAAGLDGEADATLRASLRAADDIHCISWKLRSAIDLARLLKEQGAPEEARQVLAPIHAAFSDGFETGDLRGARELLRQLG